MNDDQLNKLLEQGRKNMELPPSFRPDVWRSIHADNTQRAARWGWFNNLLNTLSHPLPAASACSLALLIGLFIGTIMPPSPSPDMNARAYAHFINPLAKHPAP